MSAVDGNSQANGNVSCLQWRSMSCFQTSNLIDTEWIRWRYTASLKRNYKTAATTVFTETWLGDMDYDLYLL